MAIRDNRARAWGLGTLVTGAVALAVWALIGASVLDATDVTFTLIWGREITEGSLPDYEAFGAITPHPLHTLLGVLATPLGEERAFDLIRVVAYLSFGLLVWGMYLLAARCFGTAAGILAALAVGTNPVILSTALSGTGDTTAFALIALAGACAAGAPRRSTPVLVLLALAGLLRPEAWAVAGLYWLFLAPPLDTSGRLRTAALALAGPVVWLIADAIVTGNPLFSLTQTQEVGADFQRTTGLANVPSEFVDGLRTLLRPPELVGGAAGLALALWLRRRTALVPGGLFAVGCAIFALFGIAEVALRQRYLLLPALMLAAFFAFAAVGWRDAPQGPARTPWTVGGVLLLGGFLAVFPSQLRDLHDLRQDTSDRAEIRDDLRDLVTQREDLFDRCPEIHAAGLKLVPLVGYHLEVSTDEVRAAERRQPREGVVLVPNDSASAAGFVTEDELARIREGLRGRFERSAGNDSWSLFTRGC